METSTKVFFAIVTLTALGACCKPADARKHKIDWNEKEMLTR